MRSMTDSVEMEIFRVGDYGAKGRYTEGDLDAIASDYLPEVHEAPLTLDHAQSGPAYGWVASVRRVGDRLVAVLRGIPESLREILRSGAFKKRSIELFRAFRATGRPYLRAVSLLGAAAPEVKGLRDVEFADAAGDVIAFDDAELALAQENAALRAQLDEMRATERVRAQDALFVDLRADGYQITPEDEVALRAMMPASDTISFGEQENDPLEWLGGFVRRMAMRVPVETPAAEANSDVDAGEPVVFCERSDAASVELHRRALEVQRRDPALSYAAALIEAVRK